MSAAAATAYVPVGWVRRIAGPVRRVANLLFSVLLTFLGLTCVTFFIGRVIPIDPVLAIVGDKASQSTPTSECASRSGSTSRSTCSTGAIS